MLLTMVNAGRRVRIMAVDAGRKLQSHLASMGLVPGVEIEVISGNCRGSFIVALEGRRMILGQGMVNKIIVA